MESEAVSGDVPTNAFLDPVKIGELSDEIIELTAAIEELTDIQEECLSLLIGISKSQRSKSGISDNAAFTIVFIALLAFVAILLLSL